MRNDKIEWLENMIKDGKGEKINEGGRTIYRIYCQADKAFRAALEATEKARIIADLAKEGTVKEIIRNIGGTADEDLKDLEQDIYYDLLRKDTAQLSALKNKGQLKFFLIKMIKNQIRSKNSPFYHKYKKQKDRKDDRHIFDNGEISTDR